MARKSRKSFAKKGKGFPIVRRSVIPTKRNKESREKPARAVSRALPAMPSVRVSGVSVSGLNRLYGKPADGPIAPLPPGRQTRLDNGELFDED